ncbi:glycosyltransferase 87 family protein [Mesorhizobium sp. Pch-S]|uniref:glycosyltransferase 87 family protein n=1 Tax=Mesorhizobium sp. Pch-S TaxID=2082387 RepID=UPI0010135F00|nr:glycosyltransferase 87 family protein [Mesorhizobium sp. Pch-S]QAZ46758.1 hypothetical protein C1M53_31385 [Mesorhizobium sp. Pch-S]
MVQVSHALYERIGFLVWTISTVVILAIAAMQPEVRSVLVAYDFGTQMFYSGGNLYNLESTMGYLYAPGFAALYFPFYAAGPIVGGLLWRCLSVGMLTWVVFKQAKRLDATNSTEMASFALFIALPLSLGAIRNGQATILLTASCWMLAMSALDGRRSATTLWAFIALLAKPSAVVVILLVGALRPKMIPNLAIAFLLVFAAPYAFAPADYVTAQHLEFFKLLTSMSHTESDFFRPADFSGVLTAIGVDVPANIILLVRLAAAGVVLAFVLWIDREGDTKRTAFAVFLLAAFYMNVFNPRAESNTYVMLAVPLALAVSYMRLGKQPLWPIYAVVIFGAGLTGLDGHLHAILNPWFKPLVLTPVTIAAVWWLSVSKSATAFKTSMQERI